MNLPTFHFAFRRFCWSFALILLSDAAQAGNGCADLSGTAIHPNVSWQTDIKPMINELISKDGRCTSCHNSGSPAAGLDLSDDNIDAIYKIVLDPLVIPGNAPGSRLFSKVNCADPEGGGQQMPLGGDPLTLAQRELIHDWIEQGAYGEDPESIDGPIARDFIFRGSMESIRIMQP